MRQPYADGLRVVECFDAVGIPGPGIIDAANRHAVKRLVQRHVAIDQHFNTASIQPAGNFPMIGPQVVIPQHCKTSQWGCVQRQCGDKWRHVLGAKANEVSAQKENTGPTISQFFSEPSEYFWVGSRSCVEIRGEGYTQGCR